MATFRGDIKGFSLVELMVVIAILAVVATIGTPFLLGMRTKSSIRADARDVHSALRQAQTEAVKRGYISCVFIDSVNKSYQVQIVDYFGSGYSPSTPIVSGKSTKFVQNQIRPGNSIVPKTLNDRTCYNYRGLPLANHDGYFDITNDSQLLTMRVTLAAGGHVKSEAFDW